jgi:hypothetical protein
MSEPMMAPHVPMSDEEIREREKMTAERVDASGRLRMADEWNLISDLVRECEHRGAEVARLRSDRNVVVSYLRRWANENRRHANALLADTMQNKPLAEQWERDAKILEDAAKAIEEERHWR